MESPSLDSFRAMTGWFSRRSGSRVSLQNPVRRVLRAQSLSRNPRPPRTTRKSDRRKVSDRTMVGLAQPLCLSASGTEPRRYDSTMNLRKCKTTAPVSNSGWMTTRSPVEGEPFLLTSPFIERDSRKLAWQQNSNLAYYQTQVYRVATPKAPIGRLAFPGSIAQR